MPTPRHITLEDLHLAQSPQGLLNLFGRLGYSVERDVIPLDKNDIGFAPADSAAIKRLFLLADEGGQAQVILFELEETALTRIRSLAGNLLSRGGNYLIVATQDYRRMVFANPRREAGTVKLRKLVVDTSHPTRHDLDVLEGLALRPGANPDQIFAAQCAAFDVEKVTDRFYREYAGLFRRVETALRENNKGTRAFYEPQELHAFTQRLLGRVMFLFFIQKKGWLAGDLRFLARQFRLAAGEERNYYATVLEPLFFETLNKRRPNDESRWGKIPYLNGGLFEKDYDFLLYLPNELFDPNSDGGVLGFFHNYNFTVAEDTPAEQEVAVDPEMLGKVFENMMEERERGKSGTFYTPRPIVHYMCREALLGFLTERSGLPRGLLAAQFDDTPAEPLTLSDAHLIEAALDSVRVLDPAVGTGAFLVGILHELVSLRLACEQAKGASVPRSSAKAAEWKRGFISNALYGVDIKSEAIEIAKLRLWLSLVVDLELRYVEPLPNLDYKLRVGNSLLETVEGEPILVGDETGVGAKTTARFSGKGGQYGLGLDSNVDARANLVTLKQKFFDSQTPEYRAEYRAQIETRERAMMLKALDEKIANLDIRIKQITDKGSLVNWRGMTREQKELETLAGRKARIAERRAEVTAGKPLPFFLPRLHFFEVFRDNGGFDIAIANPPYVRQELISDQKPDLKLAFPQVYDGVADLYVYFYARGLDLLREGGMLSFISSNKFMRAGYGKNLRKLLSENTALERVIDIGDLPVFEAIAYPCVIVTRKAKPAEGHKPLVMNVTDLDVALHLEIEAPKLAWSMPQSDFRTDGWNLKNSATLRLIEKLRATGTPLKDVVQGHFYRGVVTGSNEAFVIDEQIREKLITADPKSAEIIKPWLRGRDIKRWQIDWSNLYLIWSYQGIDIEKYPAVLAHLKQFEKALADRWEPKHGSCEWYELRHCAYYPEFEKPKILYPDIAPTVSFTYDTEGYFGGNTIYFIPTDDFYLLGVLNSKVVEFFYKQVSSLIQSNFLRFFTQFVEQIPIPSASAEERAAIAGLARRLLDCRGAGESALAALEDELNRRVYGLFGLSPDEIGIIAGTKDEES
jgi:adenine-specific DNA-methyltransferase